MRNAYKSQGGSPGHKKTLIAGVVLVVPVQFISGCCVISLVNIVEPFVLLDQGLFSVQKQHDEKPQCVEVHETGRNHNADCRDDSHQCPVKAPSLTHIRFGETF